jgi:hypothetical protein
VGTSQSLFTITAKGGRDFQRVQRKMEEAATRGIKSEIRKIVTEETKPVRKAIKQSALDSLPQSGGLNRWAAITPQGKTDFRPKYAGIKIRAEKRGHDLKSLNKGRLRHPLFGNRGHWYQQDIAPGFFDRPIQADAADLKNRIKGAIDALFEKYSREI